MNEGIKVTRKGMAFVRNICAVFDLKMNINIVSDEQIFSKSI